MPAPNEPNQLIEASKELTQVYYLRKSWSSSYYCQLSWIRPQYLQMRRTSWYSLEMNQTSPTTSKLDKRAYITCFWAEHAFQPICGLSSSTTQIEWSKCCKQRPPPCIATWDWWIDGIHCTLFLYSSIFPMGFRARRFLMEIAQAISLSHKE